MAAPSSEYYQSVDTSASQYTSLGSCFAPFGSNHYDVTSPLSASSLPMSQISSTTPANAGGSSVARRNERERKRVRMVNQGFAKLRQYVPQASRGKRLSKVDTLRSAIDYIRQLQQLLIHHPNNTDYFLFDHRPHVTLQHPMVPETGFDNQMSSLYMSSPSMQSCNWSAASSPTPSLESDIPSSPYGLPGSESTDLGLIPWPV